MSARLACCLLLCACCTAAGQAQQRPPATVTPQTAVVPEGITVGDVFHAAIRVDLPAGSDLAAPDSLALPEDLELAGRRELRYVPLDTTAALDSAAALNAPRQLTVRYPLTAWRPGTYELPPVRLQLVRGDSTRAITVRLPSFTVRSVLPEDTTGIEPKGAKDVLGANRLWWPILLALLLLLLVATALYIWWRRRRPKAEPAVVLPLVPPREAALAQLEELRNSGLLERGEVKEFYRRLTETLRRYAATVDPLWSVDLTTSELSGRMRATASPADVLELIRILGAADMVKFARASASPDAAMRDLDTARSWVERVQPAAIEPPAEERRAA